MRLPEGVTVYIGGKKYVRNIPDELAPPGIAEEKKVPKKAEKSEKKDGE